MNPNSESKDHPSPLITPARPSLWQRIGGGSLMIAAVFHGLLLLIGAFWIFQIIQQPEKKVDFLPPAGGGGERGTEHKIQQKKQAQITPTPNLKRVFAEGATASYAIPEQSESFGEKSQLSSLSGGASGGLGGSGSGGGKGEGIGTGIGDKFGPGLGGGGKGPNPFGMSDPNANALAGTFYNLNYNEDGKAIAMTNETFYEAMHDFVTHNWKESELKKFKKADQTLYQTMLYLPAMNAGGAPTAFGETADPHPRWLVVYRGTVKAPMSGKFRFVGAGDDTLTVRFNGKNVFDYGYIPSTAPREVRNLLKGTDRLKGPMRDCPMVPPVTFYPHPTTRDWNQNLGGMAAGPEITVQAGRDYPIEILIAEGWGGLFGAVLMIEESGVNYQKSPSGSPILPLFRTDGSIPKPSSADNSPPYDPQGSVWKVTSQRGFTDL